MQEFISFLTLVLDFQHLGMQEKRFNSIIHPSFIKISIIFTKAGQHNRYVYYGSITWHL